MYHSEIEANQAADFWQKTVSEKQIPANLPKITVPNFNLPLLDLAQLAEPENSKSNLRRLLEQGAIELLGNQVLRIGKKKYYQLVLA